MRGVKKPYLSDSPVPPERESAESFNGVVQSDYLCGSVSYETIGTVIDGFSPLFAEMAMESLLTPLRSNLAMCVFGWRRQKPSPGPTSRL